ncbi:ejaculatory bulb-specific protein 3-like [Athalia rosae]|uniref:ejaculatory bulb-specific protein 3-like n=1 Tax=Athalia rosae TaxID=37344 RepID=UPI0006268E84|nr:ejaculatory bulb-specific protein 3-like [Athalia rosae]
MFRLRFAIGLIVAAVSTAVLAEELYSDKYDYIKPEEILENNRLRDQYYACFIGSSPCITPDAKFFKSNFPEAIVTQCRKCTEKQKRMFDTLSTWYTEKRPDEWKALIAKFIEDARKKKIIS